MIPRLSFAGRADDEIRREAARHGLRLSPDEWRQVADRVGRDLTLPEAMLFDVSWSEHCSYKSSRPFLKKLLPPLAPHVLLGPGEDAGVVSLGTWCGEEWTLVVAHESHNHPSQVLPVEGAATGVGGIVRDVYCMGADVVGVLDSLRFGDPDGANAERTRAIVRGVVQGIEEYGNALGVPNVGGEVVFHEGFDDNCLVNVVAFGVAPRRRIIRSRVPDLARSEPFVLLLVGKPTDATGLGGASFASQILDEGEARENRGAVQIHDPFLKRVLVDAMKEVWDLVERERIPVGCKDLGAGGLGGASSELVFAGGFGAEIDLESVPRGIDGLEPHEILCGETQERFVFAVPESAAAAICAIFNERYELERIYPRARAAVIGRVLEERIYRSFWRGEEVVALTAEVLAEPPEVRRVAARRPGPPPVRDPKPPVDWSVWIRDRLTHWNAASRAAVYRFYDPEVQGLAFLRPGEAGAGVLRPIPGATLGIAVSMAGVPEYGRLDAYWCGALAVLEAVRNVAATGACPLCLTDCLNFGNPEDPIALGELEDALRGMADACRAIGAPADPAHPLPIVSGNVSLYNFSAAGRSIPPSPIVACFGTLADYGRAVTPRLKRAGNLLVVVGCREQAWGHAEGSTTGAEPPAGRVPRPDLQRSGRETRAVLARIEAGEVASCAGIASGGILKTLWRMAVQEEQPGALGCRIDLGSCGWPLPIHEALVSESPGFVLEVEPRAAASLLGALGRAGVDAWSVGEVTDAPRLEILDAGQVVATFDWAAAHATWAARLEDIFVTREEHQ